MKKSIYNFQFLHNGLMKLSRFHFFHQLNQTDCIPAFLMMISAFYGKILNIDHLRKLCQTKEEFNLITIGDLAQEIGFQALAKRIFLHQLNELELPYLLHWNQEHFILLYRIKLSKTKKTASFHIVDPAKGKIKLNEFQMRQSFVTDYNQGVAILFKPTEQFYQLTTVSPLKSSFQFLYNCMRLNRKHSLNHH